MSKTDNRFIEDRLAMMETEGWFDLIADLEKIKSSVVDIDTMTDDKDLWSARGQLNILRFLLTLENTTKITMEQSQED
jgi:hypothetical protein|tara:strand:- start:373 stop:606 length:234 start_codon:yes stop_codon:yes gene_type:complete